MTQLQDFLNSPLQHVTRANQPFKVGDIFGVEIELEGNNVAYRRDDDDIVKSWNPVQDGSLRNNPGPPQEWIFRGPAKFTPALKRIDALFEYLTKNKAVIRTSNRTSVHVHFNMGDKNVYQLVNMFILFTIFEDILDRYCGEDRRGNLFCLSSRHAERQVNWMEDSVLRDYSFQKLREEWRYCSFNFASLNKFGTVEFRGMRGLDNANDVKEWVGILNEFTQYACYKMKNPVTVIEQISLMTPVGFLKEVFPDNHEVLSRGLPDDILNQSIYDGLRIVQMLCYRIGTEFDKVRLKGPDFWASLGGDVAPVVDDEPRRARPAFNPRPGGLQFHRIRDVNEIILDAQGRFPVRPQRDRQVQPEADIEFEVVDVEEENDLDF